MNKCQDCENQLKTSAYRFQYGGCVSSYHCFTCHKNYVCDSGKAEKKIVEGNTTYIYGPCACGFQCCNKLPPFVDRTIYPVISTG